MDFPAPLMPSCKSGASSSSSLHTVKTKKTHGRRAAARKEAKVKREVAREKTEHLELVVKQDTVLRGVEREATTIRTPLSCFSSARQWLHDERVIAVE